MVLVVALALALQFQFLPDMSFGSSPVLLSPSPAASFLASAPVSAPVSSSPLQFHCNPFFNNLNGMNSGTPFSFSTAPQKRPRSDTPEASSSSFFVPPQQKRVRQDFGDAVPTQPSTRAPANLWATDSADQNISMRRGVGLPTATVGSGVVGASAPFAGAGMTVESQAMVFPRRAGQKTKRGESIFDFSSNWTATEAAQQLSSLTPEEEDLRAFYSTERERSKRPVTAWTSSPSQPTSSADERSLVCVPSSTPSRGFWNEPQATPFSPSTLDNRLSVPWMEDTARAIIPYSPATTMPTQLPPCSPPTPAAYWRLKTTPSVTSIEEVLDEDEDDTPTAMSM